MALYRAVAGLSEAINSMHNDLIRGFDGVNMRLNHVGTQLVELHKFMFKFSQNVGRQLEFLGDQVEKIDTYVRANFNFHVQGKIGDLRENLSEADRKVDNALYKAVEMLVGLAMRSTNPQYNGFNVFNSFSFSPLLMRMKIFNQLIQAGVLDSNPDFLLAMVLVARGTLVGESMVDNLALSRVENIPHPSTLIKVSSLLLQILNDQHAADDITKKKRVDRNVALQYLQRSAQRVLELLDEIISVFDSLPADNRFTLLVAQAHNDHLKQLDRAFHECQLFPTTQLARQCKYNITEQVGLQFYRYILHTPVP
jgi:hypothetical protein